MSTPPARRRLLLDFKDLKEDPPAGISGAPTDDNLLVWQAVIFGPQETAFEGGTFELSIKFTEEYPLKPPKVRFLSKMFHPNVCGDGEVCLDILQERWTPAYNVSAILTSVQSVLGDPDRYRPVNSVAAHLLNENRQEYVKRVKACVEQSWVD